MIDCLYYSRRLQIEMEASLHDVLSVLRLSTKDPLTAKSAKFIESAFSQIPQDVRMRAILDPRIVSALEEIQRLIGAFGEAALARREWNALSDIVLRMEIFCLIALNRSGTVAIEDASDGWIGIPGTSLYLTPACSRSGVTVHNGSVIEADLVDVRATEDPHSDAAPIIALPEASLCPPVAGKKLLSLSGIEREEWASALADAFHLLQRHNPSSALVRSHVWLLVPLEDDENGVFSSVSFNTLPNAIYMSRHSNLMFAETLVHEADHQWLYTVARFEEFWLEPGDIEGAWYRSPWREDPRPLDGLLWGGSAFVRVSSMWAGLARSLPPGHSALPWIRERAVLCSYQAMDALQTVRRHGKLCAFGKTFLASLIGQAIVTREQLREDRDFSKSLLSAERAQREHDTIWSMRNPEVEQVFPFRANDYLNFEMPS